MKNHNTDPQTFQCYWKAHPQTKLNFSQNNEHVDCIITNAPPIFNLGPTIHRHFPYTTIRNVLKHYCNIDIDLYTITPNTITV